jgi:hypothetical protein
MRQIHWIAQFPDHAVPSRSALPCSPTTGGLRRNVFVGEDREAYSLLRDQSLFLDCLEEIGATQGGNQKGRGHLRAAACPGKLIAYELLLSAPVFAGCQNTSVGWSQAYCSRMWNIPNVARRLQRPAALNAKIISSESRNSNRPIYSFLLRLDGKVQTAPVGRVPNSPEQSGRVVGHADRRTLQSLRRGCSCAGLRR